MQYFFEYEIDVSFYYHNLFLVLSFAPQVRILVPSLEITFQNLPLLYVDTNRGGEGGGVAT